MLAGSSPMSRIAKLPILPLLFTLLLIFRYDGSLQAVQSSQTNALPYFTEPSVSPGGSEIAFVSGGDIWTAPVNGGEARLLVSHPANESRPLYSPDGKRMAFVSTRTGNGDIYLLTFETGELKRLTFDDAGEQLDAWSRDGRLIYFSSTSRDISGMTTFAALKPTAGLRCSSAPIATPTNIGPRPRRTETASPSPRAASLLRNGGATAAATLTNAKSGCCATPATNASRTAARRRCGRCGAPTASRSISFPTAAARRTSGSSRSAARPNRSPNLKPTLWTDA